MTLYKSIDSLPFSDPQMAATQQVSTLSKENKKRPPQKGWKMIKGEGSKQREFLHQKQS